MTIERRLVLIAIFCLLLSLCVGAGLYATGSSYSEAVRAEEAIEKVRRQLVVLNSLTSDYLLYFDSRSRQQWTVMGEEVEGLLGSLRKTVPEEVLSLRRVEARSRELTDLFGHLTRIVDGIAAGGEDRPRLEALRMEVSAQLHLTSRDILDQIGGFVDMQREKRNVARRRLGMLMFAMIAALSGVLLVILLWIRRGILNPLSLLKGGAEAISQGDYEKRVRLTTDDELQSLAGSFNNMADSIIGKIRDLDAEIEERERTAEALIRSERQYRELVQSANSIILRWDVQGRVKYINRYGEKFFGFSREEIVGWSVLDTIVPEVESTGRDLAPMIEGIISQTEEFILNENENVRKNGERVWVSWTNQAIYDHEGELVEILSIGNDITGKKAAEKELDSYRQRLEELVRDRTGQLREAQADLVRQERLAALGHLTATVAHELRNPLGTVGLGVQAIGEQLGKECTGQIARPLDLVRRNVRRCDRIIEELLDFTRDKKVEMERTDLGEWLGRVIDEQEIPGGIECTRSFAEGLEVRIDREHFRRAVVNVLDNSLQAMRDGSGGKGRLSVASARSGPRVLIRISDTGPGVSAEELPKVFEPLFSTKSFGVGLGLPIVRDLAEKHGGGISIESPPGEGTTVTLWLPAREAGVVKP